MKFSNSLYHSYKLLIYFFLLFLGIFFYSPQRIYGLTNFKMSNNIYEINKINLKDRIEKSKNFLLKMEHPREHGFYKYYLPNEDKHFENRLHTTYSASAIYSLLFVYEYDKDKTILEKIPQWGDFLLRMQNTKPNSKNYGAFTYSFFPDKKGLNFGEKINSLTINSEGEILNDTFYIDEEGRELKYVVGTNSKTIFTLLRFYEYTGDKKYLDAAKLAGDWLITMQNNNGIMRDYSRYQDGKWYLGKKESLLYNGQALLAFSRLYNVTKEEKYFSAAKKIAAHFVDKINKANGEFIKDDYRETNDISNSWVVMSLMDFYKISPDEVYKNIIFEYSSKIVANQIANEKDLVNFGRYKTAFSSSGNGWIAEVLTEVWRFCLQEEGAIGCQKYKDSVLKAIKFISRYTYSDKNSLNFKKPEEIIGGIYWDDNHKHIRTDSVAHSLNAYTRMINYLAEEKIILAQVATR